VPVLVLVCASVFEGVSWMDGAWAVAVSAAGIGVHRGLDGFARLPRVVAAMVALVFAEIVRDAHDPTAHDLWPFEVILAVGMGAVAAFLGWAFGAALRFAMHFSRDRHARDASST
jgi:hypothetical protein